jgi:prolyl oligopeptidase
MEERPAPEFDRFLRAQDAYARNLLSRISGRDQLAAKIKAISANSSYVQDVVATPGKYFYKYFYLKRAAGLELAKLFVRSSDTGAEKLLIDPERLGDEHKRLVIDQFSPSRDGRFVAYGVSESGSEDSVLRIVETDSGRMLPESIDRARFAEVSWAPDGRSFFYTRLAKPASNAPENERYDHLRVFRHRLRTNPDADLLVLDADALPFPVKASQVFPAVQVVGSDQVLAIISDGVSQESAYFSARLSELKRRSPAWRKIAGTEDGVVTAAVNGSDIYLLSHSDAPRFKVVKTSLKSPDFSSAQTVLAQGAEIITSIAAAADALYVTRRNGVSSELLRLPYGDRALQPVSLPLAGKIARRLDVQADQRMPGIVFGMESWTQPLVWLRYDPKTSKVSKTNIAPPFERDLSAYEAAEVSVRSADGATVPLSIVAKRGLVLDGSHPTLMDGYGSYGAAFEPAFIPALIPWLDRGGVYAVAHVRGGGEYGKQWHDAGKKAGKENAVGDFIACAEYLIAQRYTGPGLLAGQGFSAGAIVVGGVVTRRPDLLAAAVLRVGMTNPLRDEVTEGGLANVAEFGSVENAEDFPALLGMDAYHNVRDGTRYPAVLLTGGLQDHRVPIWMPAKMTARLQAATTSGRPVLLRVDFDAGHGFGTTRTERDEEAADEQAFLLWQFGLPEFQLGR